MIIQHNLLSMNTARQLNINTKSKARSTEKLSSGYRVNRAADDAAVLTISEGMRRQIRGLTQGTDNAQDGVSFVKIADQAMSEVSEILQRMSELSIKSLNGSNTQNDRDAMQAEFNGLQAEIDRICRDTEMNTLAVFEQHEDTYHGIKGNRFWVNTEKHLVEDGRNQLTFMVKDPETGADVTHSISVAAGVYTTQELADEIDDALTGQLADHPEFVFEYSKDGFCNLLYEGGEDIESINGGLSYLFFDNHDGGSFGSLMGTTQFVGSNPLVVTAHNNELEFYMEDILGTTSTKVSLRITPGNYTRTQMIDCINSELTKNGVTGISASEFGDYSIQLGGDKYLVTGLKGNMFEIDDGNYSSVFYDNVRYGSISNTKAYFQGSAYLTTNTADTEHNRFKIDASNKELKIRVNAAAGTSYTTLTLTEGDYTAQQIAAHLNDLFAANGLEADAAARYSGSTFQYLYIGSRLSGNGSKIDIDSSSSCYNTLFQKTEYLDLHSVSPTAGSYSNTPPKYASGKNISVPLTVGSGGNTLKLNLTDNTNTTSSYTLTLAAGTYNTLDDIIAALNSDIQSKAGIQDKIVAAKSGGSIVFTTGTDGGDINQISVGSTAPGSIYDDLFTKETQVLNNFNQTASGTGSFTLPQAMPADIVINGNNTLRFTVDGVTRTATVANGTYSQADFAKAISDQLKGSSVSVPNTVNLSGTGSQTIIEGTTIPGNTKPAKITFAKALDSSITIGDSTNELIMEVNGTQKSITLASGVYTRSGLVAELNKQFQAGGIGVSASLTSNRLTFQTELEGVTASLKLNSGTGGSALAAIAGSTTTTVAGVKASFVNNKLVISGDTPGHTVNFNSSNGGGMAAMLVGSTTVSTPGTSTARKVLSSTANIDGVNLGSAVTINADNKKVHFNYQHNGTDYTVDFDLDEKTYTLTQLQDELKANIDAQTGGSSLLNVTVNTSGVKISAQSPGSQYKLSGFSGGFHSYVISGSKLILRDGPPTIRDGVQTVNSPYIVGRQDITNKPITVKSGENDELKLDFTVPDPVTGTPEEYTMELKLDEGTYQGNSLIAQIQNKLDSQLVHHGFAAGTIKAGIGGITSGVVGANDSTALNFTIPADAVNMKAGTYKIDGVRGNAAYYIFYKTLGEPIPAYTVGTKDISGGVSMEEGRNVFTFTADSTDYSYTFPPGSYSTQEFLDLFNDMLENGDDSGQTSDIRALMEGNSMKLAFSVSGKHSIKPIGGSARRVIFYEDEGRINAHTDKALQVGLGKGDNMELETMRLNTNYLEINTICITKEKYADKAVRRLEKAMDKLNHDRSVYGARQNRLEHTINANNNTHENLAASEARMRDTDIASEMIRQSRYRILEQVGQSLAAQANQLPDRLLQLIR